MKVNHSSLNTTDCYSIIHTLKYHMKHVQWHCGATGSMTSIQYSVCVDTPESTFALIWAVYHCYLALILASDHGYPEPSLNVHLTTMAIIRLPLTCHKHHVQQFSKNIKPLERSTTWPFWKKTIIGQKKHASISMVWHLPTLNSSTTLNLIAARITISQVQKFIAINSKHSLKIISIIW